MTYFKASDTMPVLVDISSMNHVTVVCDSSSLQFCFRVRCCLCYFQSLFKVSFHSNHTLLVLFWHCFMDMFLKVFLCYMFSNLTYFLLVALNLISFFVVNTGFAVVIIVIRKCMLPLYPIINIM
jgi:hypothetical protein